MLVNEGVPIFFVFGAQYLSRMWHEFHLSRIDLVSNSARGCGITYTVHFRKKTSSLKVQMVYKYYAIVQFYKVELSF